MFQVGIWALESRKRECVPCSSVVGVPACGEKNGERIQLTPDKRISSRQSHFCRMAVKEISMHEVLPTLIRAELRRSVSLSRYSTLEIGGEARFLVSIRDPTDLPALLNWSEGQEIPRIIIGEGSNVLFPDSGFPGLVVQILIPGIEREGNEVTVGAGENLGRVIEWLNQHGLQGMERMYGIPGSLAGAVIGNAGAYGQEIGQVLTEATVLAADGKITSMPAAELDFQYRHSLFKQDRTLILLNCRLRLGPGKGSLQEVSDSILKKRSGKYPPGMKCPGSYFKNVKVEELNEDQLERIPTSFVMHGKVPAGKLLEAVGANGARKGDAAIASYHGNLIMNNGRATARDIVWLAEKYCRRVQESFGIQLQPEIRVVPEKGTDYE